METQEQQIEISREVQSIHSININGQVIFNDKIYHISAIFKVGYGIIEFIATKDKYMRKPVSITLKKELKELVNEHYLARYDDYHMPWDRPLNEIT
tara:strand:- start:189 stop:476 length:288 start_codon:yes stop_codon:yes gene_type:complete